MKPTERITQLTEDKLEEYKRADPRFMESAHRYREAVLVRGMGMYLDEEQVRREAWEKSVEERLTNIGLGAGPGFRPVPPVTVRFDEEKPPAVRIEDPGPGKYDREPLETEE